MRPPAGPPPEAILFRASSLSAVDLFGVFNASPNPYVILDLELTIVGCNDAYLRVTGRTRDDIVGRNMFDAFPADPGTPGGRLLRASLAKVIAEGEPDEIALIPYDTSRPGEAPAMRYWSATHTPIRDGEGRLAFILQHTTDVTEVERLRSASAAQNEAGILNRAAAVQAENVALSQQSSQLRRLFQQTPSFMAMVEGPDHVFTLVNDAYSGLVGHRPDLIGKPAAQALPEVVEQGFIALLDQVRTTGEPFIGRAAPILLQQGSGGLPERRYLDFIYQPIREPDGGVSGIFVQGHDITEQKVAQSELERQREILRLAQEAGGVGTFVWDLVSGYIAGSETLYGDRQLQMGLTSAPSGAFKYRRSILAGPFARRGSRANPVHLIFGQGICTCSMIPLAADTDPEDETILQRRLY
ncbi:PAS domain-containing protein [Devosia sp. RR2S18]|uniref:PAS domain-containing protein n=1 Tax=Devosia rhizosphaerae TaxID=3049774 RepID=UPI002541F3E7|nr:GGDEF and EAL domain-containing protein [Devosia sp. RR2S18]WIJ25002.1 PAS domain-containing protein [Devosia sp. RR2S18]